MSIYCVLIGYCRIINFPQIISSSHFFFENGALTFLELSLTIYIIINILRFAYDIIITFKARMNIKYFGNIKHFCVHYHRHFPSDELSNAHISHHNKMAESRLRRLMLPRCGRISCEAVVVIMLVIVIGEIYIGKTEKGSKKRQWLFPNWLPY